MTGVYAIQQAGGARAYVGSSVAIARRFSQHRTLLRSDKHQSPFLQNAWNKYGEAAFEFVVVEECPREALIEREQHHLDLCLEPFNCAPVAGSRFGVPHPADVRARISASHAGVPKSLETRARMSAACMGRSRPQTAETRARISASTKGKPKSPETRARMVAAQGLRREMEIAIRSCA